MKLLFLLLCVPALADAPVKQAYLVCEGRCLTSVKVGPKSQLVVPLVDGKPDYKHAVFSGLVVEMNHSLEKIEMR